VLFNLVGNACKCTTQGSVTLSTRFDQDSQTVCVEVIDTGCGIHKDRLKSIFDPFNTGDQRATRRVGGAGLGLHLVQELVKAHNGWVDVQSELKVGSTFTVHLPIQAAGGVEVRQLSSNT
jgi:signal transduction histidine kinase